MWVLTGERERFCCIHIIGKSIRLWLGLRGNTVAVLLTLITGPETTPELAEATLFTAAAIQARRSTSSQGHGHVAHRSESRVVAQVLRSRLK
jgi:hypothetical protein